jgi:NAD(P)-dependent dehydrogenase (short-subunit alcohol dehydrogenase family)
MARHGAPERGASAMQLDASIAAVVTGGASGLGEATTRRLAAHGVKVAIFDLNAERGEAVAREVGGIFCPVNVTDEASVEAGFQRARAAHGVERILVNCAGIAPGKRTVSKKRDTGELVAHDIASFANTVAINLTGTFICIARSAVAMAGTDTVTPDGGRGVIIMTSSVAAEDGQIGQAAYSATKGGILGMTLPIARDLSGFGIRVMSIQPGIFWTPLFDKIDEGFRKSLEQQVPFPQRLGRPGEYAELVESICRNDMLNGTTIRLDGAIRMAPK